MRRKTRLRRQSDARRADELARQLIQARAELDILRPRARRAAELDRECLELRRALREAQDARPRFRIYEAEHAGRSASSWATEAQAVRELWHAHHLEGECPAQGRVNILLRLLERPGRYRRVDNWRVVLTGDGYAWTCSICDRTYPAPLGFAWAVRPCPHPGAPDPLS